jgi:tRNA modification GTPase
MNDTICALATAPGGALGIIRVSGPNAFAIVSAVSSVSCDAVAANTIHYGHIVECDAVSQHQNTIDEVLVSVFRAPHSYTGEDSVEISCHGSRYIINKVLEQLCQHGCRMARPGEFTQRAYLNGKMDLSQAEAVADLIASTNKATHQLAMSQLRGGITTELSRLREQLLQLTSLLELELDFSDHEDLEFADRKELSTLANKIDKHITSLARSFEMGNALKQGVPVAIVGKTNVGKSTLLNRLLKDDRAIVSDVHGTTRDTIEDTIDIQGVTFRFIDTAGIRQTTDQVEQIGIERTFQAIQKARIVLWIIDEQPSEEEINELEKQTENKQLIIVKNKIDKTGNNGYNLLNCPVVSISAKFGTGIEALEQAIFEAADVPSLTEDVVIVTNARHYDALVRAHAHLQRVIDGLSAGDSSLSALHPSLPPDLLSEDLRQALDTLAEITGGQITPNEVLKNIFTKFCVGK